MKLIATVTLTTTTNFEFQNIPQIYTDLKLTGSFRTNKGSISDANLTINGGLETVSHPIRNLSGTGSSVFTGFNNFNNANLAQMAIGTDYTSNTFNNIELYFPNYTGSTQKSFSLDGVTENNATASYQTISAGLFQSTNPITRLLIDSAGATLIAGSTFSLYGITKGSDGIVTTS
jgi:hypothetical protein